MVLHYEYELPIPKSGQIFIFRNKADGGRYYKTNNGEIKKLKRNDNDDSYYVSERGVSSIISYTGESIKSFVSGIGTHFLFYIPETNRVTRILAGGGGASGSGTADIRVINSISYSNTSIPESNTIANQAGSDVAFGLPQYTIVSDYLRAGTNINVRLFGIYSTDAESPPTINFKIKLNNNAYIDSGQINTIGGSVNMGWKAEANIIIFNTGILAEADVQGSLELGTTVTSSINMKLINSATQTINTNVNQDLTVTINWGTADIDNSITLRNINILVNLPS